MTLPATYTASLTIRSRSRTYRTAPYTAAVTTTTGRAVAIDQTAMVKNAALPTSHAR